MSFFPLTVTTKADGGLFTNFGCDPSKGPWQFRRLAEPELTSEIQRFANAKTSSESGARIDSIHFQPTQGEENSSQDRIYSGSCLVSERPWSLAGIFDGHAGEECAEYTLRNFPQYLERALSVSSENDITSTLKDAFISFDNAITDQLLAIFPDPAKLAQMSAEELSTMINDQATGGTNYDKVILAMRGTTALVSLVDQERKNLWVAGVGDCRAILGVKLPDGRWEARDLLAPHNGGNPEELRKVEEAHPGEPEVTLKNRVLGAIAVTRAFGDVEFKISAEYTHQVFLRANPGFRVHSSVQDFAKRNITPPYLSAVPDIVHTELEANPSAGTPRFLILTSDGSTDEHLLRMIGRTEAESFQRWVELVGARLETEASTKGKETPSHNNLAMDVLRDAFGGSNEEVLSMYLTLEMESKWSDDTSIQVVVF